MRIRNYLKIFVMGLIAVCSPLLATGFGVGVGISNSRSNASAGSSSGSSSGASINQGDTIVSYPAIPQPPDRWKDVEYRILEEKRYRDYRKDVRRRNWERDAERFLRAERPWQKKVKSLMARGYTQQQAEEILRQKENLPHPNTRFGADVPKMKPWGRIDCGIYQIPTYYNGEKEPSAHTIIGTKCVYTDPEGNKKYWDGRP